MTRWLYTLLLYLLTPVVLLRLLWRGMGNHGYWQRWGERFGLFKTSGLRNPIWVHATSVGETQAAEPLIQALAKRSPQHSLVVTTTTPTGSNRVHVLFGASVFHVYLPYDLPGAVQRYLERVQPCIAIIMETELWPNLIHQCRQRTIPVIIANARLSPKSAAGYRRVAALTRNTLSGIPLIAAQGERDAERFIDLGAAKECVQVIGNLKFDQSIPAEIKVQAQALRQQWGGPERPVWIAASTHEGEDEPILEAHEQVRQRYPNCLLVLVPRHPERSDNVAALCKRRGFDIIRRTEKRPCNPDIAVFLGDTLGELNLFYAASDLAFVGGSLVSTGGHNMLEPAALGLAIITGPHLFNFVDISAALLEAGVARKVENASELALEVDTLLQDPKARKRAGERGRQLVKANRGALDRLLALIETFI